MIYLDNAATTKLDPQALSEMLPYYTEKFGNAGSNHRCGNEAEQALQTARKRVAAAIGAEVDEIVFTSGGTESNNWAITAVHGGKKKHIISTNIEHHAILRPLHMMEKQGFDVTYLAADRNGYIYPEQVLQAIRPDTALVSIMSANNETGAIEPIAQIGKICREHQVLFHTDAVQAVGHIPTDVKALQVDLLSMSAHKFHAPKGIGALYIRKGLHIPALLRGGRQEAGRRAGTENIPAIVGMGAALEQSIKHVAQRQSYTRMLRERLRCGLLKYIPECRINTPENCLPGILNISIKGVDAQALLQQLDLHGICAAAGAACTAGDEQISHVLRAIGLDEKTARSTIRFSLDHSNTINQIDQTCQITSEIVKKLRLCGEVSF